MLVIVVESEIAQAIEAAAALVIARVLRIAVVASAIEVVHLRSTIVQVVIALVVAQEGVAASAVAPEVLVEPVRDKAVAEVHPAWAAAAVLEAAAVVAAVVVVVVVAAVAAGGKQL